MARKPTPKVVSEVCSLCGLDWNLHGAEPTTETCIALLLDEINSLNARLAQRPYIQPINIPVYPRPWPRPWPYSPYYGSTWSSGTNIASSNLPATSNAIPRALTAQSRVPYRSG
jgi:hypothetical protein